MGHPVTISDYWNGQLEKWIRTGIRKSKAEIVEEGLKQVRARLDYEADSLEEAKEIQKERQEERKEEDVLDQIE